MDSSWDSAFSKSLCVSCIDDDEFVFAFNGIDDGCVADDFECAVGDFVAAACRDERGKDA